MRFPLGFENVLRGGRNVILLGELYSRFLRSKISSAKFVFIHSITNNIGDLMSCPIRYFDIFSPENSVEFSSKDIVDLIKSNGADAVLRSLEGKVVVFGGGGLIGLDRHTVHERAIDFLAQFAGRGGDVVVWGAGHNRIEGFREWLDGFDASPYPSSFERFRLVGLRDQSNPYDWVPCVSCMHPAFDEKFASRHDCVAFLHAHESGQFGGEFSGIPNMLNIKKGNKRNPGDVFSECIRFIGSGKTLITNSYHGLYWGTLLGKEVIAIQNSSKFLDFKYKYTNCEDFRGWRDHIGKGHSHSNALAECRDANRKFMRNFETLIHS